jgi:hypothetical protein
MPLGPQSFCLSQYYNIYDTDEIQEMIDYINNMLKNNPRAWDLVVEGRLLESSPILKVVTELIRNRVNKIYIE